MRGGGGTDGGMESCSKELCFLNHILTDIAQWSVFAIRNLCENNPLNQQLIAGLRARGVCPPDEEALRASGGEVEVGEDGRIRVKKREGRV